MITPPQPDDFAVPMEEEEKGPGEQLREARQIRNLTIDDVAMRLHLHPAMVHSLEKEAYDKLPGPVFIRGYLSVYARLLNIAPTPILDAFDRRNLAPPVLSRNIANQPQVCSSHILVRITTYVIISCLALLVFFWWKNTISPDDYTKYEEFATLLEQPSRQQLPEQGSLREETKITLDNQENKIASDNSDNHVPPLSETPFIGEEDTPTDISVNRELPERSQDEVTTGNPPYEPSINVDRQKPAPILERNNHSMTLGVSAGEVVSVPSTMPKMDRIVVHLSADSWMEIHDGLGKRLYYQLGLSGQTYEFQGIEPFRVVLGYAHAATITYNGKLFDHTPYIQDELAEFSVGNSTQRSAD
uniref:Protein RodZ, contains Xre-like HTH and DUF4115 domains n=1 Tax=Candidatus Kentrum sp. FW TaxID=2126338 RepID=A0A450S8G8_9GAMM|nr:MAG: protein RodZ, contains Xre-like HTH and DUF4115 domains [Candidatus Kentron sp. FW]